MNTKNTTRPAADGARDNDWQEWLALKPEGKPPAEIELELTIKLSFSTAMAIHEGAAHAGVSPAEVVARAVKLSEDIDAWSIGDHLEEFGVKVVVGDDAEPSRSGGFIETIGERIANELEPDEVTKLASLCKEEGLDPARVVSFALWSIVNSLDEPETVAHMREECALEESRPTCRIGGAA
jgi:hypothetical protein